MTTPELSSRRADTVEAAEVVTWRCFHCDEVFISEDTARLHFGSDESRVAACVIKAGAEGSLVRALREAEDAAAAAIHKMHDESTEGYRAYYSGASRHGPQLQAAEEAGYEKGLADGRAEVSSQVEGLKVERDEALVNTELARQNFHVMQIAANELRIRAEKAEAALASQAIPEGFVHDALALAVEGARTAKSRLEFYADEANAGRQQGGGREMKRKIWGAFADFDAALAAIPAAPEVNK